MKFTPGTKVFYRIANTNEDYEQYVNYTANFRRAYNNHTSTLRNTNNYKSFRRDTKLNLYIQQRLSSKTMWYIEILYTKYVDTYEELVTQKNRLIKKYNAQKLSRKMQ